MSGRAVSALQDERLSAYTLFAHASWGARVLGAIGLLAAAWYWLDDLSSAWAFHHLGTWCVVTIWGSALCVISCVAAWLLCFHARVGVLIPAALVLIPAYVVTPTLIWSFAILFVPYSDWHAPTRIHSGTAIVVAVVTGWRYWAYLRSPYLATP
jgi:hypothetical protein